MKCLVIITMNEMFGDNNYDEQRDEQSCQPVDSNSRKAP